MSTTDLIHIENDWKNVTITGNNLVNTAVKKALLNYKIALNKAEKLMEHQFKCSKLKIPVTHIFIISCNNLSETYSLIKKWDKAEKLLKRSIYYIEYLNHQNPESDSAYIASKQLFKQLLLFKEFSERSNQTHKYDELQLHLNANIKNYSTLSD